MSVENMENEKTYTRRKNRYLKQERYQKLQKAFFWTNSSPKTKYGTFCNDYKAGGLKNIDIPNKII